MKYSGKVDIDHILNSDWLAGIVARETDQVAARAFAEAPKDTGELAGSIRSYTEKHSGAKRDRVVGVVEATAPHSLAAEFGNSRSRGRFFLRRSLG